jgi:hypothetical protein
MKIEIDIDAERIHRDVVDRIVAWAASEIKDEVQRLVKASILSELREQAKGHVRDILVEFVLPDGRSFKNYITDLLTKPGAYQERPRLMELAATSVRDYGKQWWTEIFEQHMPDLKESLRKQLMDTTLDAFIQIKR